MPQIVSYINVVPLRPLSIFVGLPKYSSLPQELTVV